MSSAGGATPPLHRKCDEVRILATIKSRYVGLKAITPQVEALRSEPRFIARCEGFYREGYKDWHILGAICNRMLMLRQMELGLRGDTPESLRKVAELNRTLPQTVYPTEKFLGDSLVPVFKLHALTCAAGYGFTPRVPPDNDVIIRFLRERMKHFDLDVPHDPIFREPFGVWPLPGLE